MKIGAVLIDTQDERCATRNTKVGRWCCLLSARAGPFGTSVHVGRCLRFPSIAPRFHTATMQTENALPNGMRHLQAEANDVRAATTANGKSSVRTRESPEIAMVGSKSPT